MSYDNNSDHTDEFLFAKVKQVVTKKQKTKVPPHKPTPFEVDFDDELKEIESKGVEYQVRETAQILEKKTIREEGEIFYSIYPKSEISEVDVKDLLTKLKATIVAYTDRKNNGILLSASAEKLKKLSEKPTRYLINSIRIIKPLEPEEQIGDELKKENIGIQMAILSIIPNLTLDKIYGYMSKLTSFLNDNRCPIYATELQKYGFVFADITLAIVQQLIEKSTFIFRATKVPDAVAYEIRMLEKVKTESKTNESSQNNLTNKFLPTVVLMDSGVNNVKPLQGVLLERDSYLFTNLDDEHNDPGHGTPVAHLIAFGEGDKEPAANIISYKIWSEQERRWAYTGLINGIEKYSSQTRLFTSSIGIPFLPLEQIVTLEKLVQEKNICLIVSAGNIDLPDIKTYLLSGARYPDYLRFFPVMPPANGVNIVAVGSIAKRANGTSIARQNQISPHSRCGAGAVELSDCKKPELVEHGGNVNIDGSLNLNTDGVGVNSIDKNGNPVDHLSGSSFSSPLLIRRIAQIERRYRTRINNVETLLAVTYLTSNRNSDSCGGYGEPATVVGADHNTAIYLAEGNLGFGYSDDKTTTTPSDDIIFYVPPSVNEIQLCIVHSDNFKKAVLPTLETFLEVKAQKLGNQQQIYPQSRADLNLKTNVKILTYKFDSKSMESIWTFSVKPRVIHDILSEDKKSIKVRYGCAILLKGKLDRQSKKSLTQEVIENREKYLQ